MLINIAALLYAIALGILFPGLTSNRESFAAAHITSFIGSFPALSILPFTEIDIRCRLKDADHSPFNHIFVDRIASIDRHDVPPKGYKIKSKVVECGKGIETFHRASKIMKRFAMINGLSWAKFVSQDSLEILAPGSTVATVVKCYGLVWSFNPCRIVTAFYDNQMKIRPLLADEKRCSEISFATLEGHLIAGAEKFRVVLHSDERVTYEMISFTKGAGLFGSISMPFIRPLQSHFFNDQAKLLLQLLKTER